MNQRVLQSSIEEETLVEESTDLETSVADGWQIVLYNDEHNTFDHVIECLMAYCAHEVLQAEQCALIVHTRGKCSVKTGDYAELEPICTALSERDLTAEVEPI
jgi:ATP-dependent Clp protease adaptor protein ClpS